MVSATDRGPNGEGLSVISWGWRGSHRLWRVMDPMRPGQRADLTGPTDALAALMKASRARDHLPWQALPTD